MKEETKKLLRILSFQVLGWAILGLGIAFTLKGCEAEHAERVKARAEAEAMVRTHSWKYMKPSERSGQLFICDKCSDVTSMHGNSYYNFLTPARACPGKSDSNPLESVK